MRFDAQSLGSVLVLTVLRNNPSLVLEIGFQSYVVFFVSLFWIFQIIIRFIEDGSINCVMNCILFHGLLERRSPISFKVVMLSSRFWIINHQVTHVLILSMILLSKLRSN